MSMPYAYRITDENGDRTTRDPDYAEQKHNEGARVTIVAW